MSSSVSKHLISIIVIITMVITSTVTFHAVSDNSVYAASGKVKITFKSNGGKFAKKSIKKKTVKVNKKFGKLAKLKKRSGYKFAGWYSAKTDGVKVTKNTKLECKANLKLYAQWKYSVSFKGNSGKASKSTKKITSGKKYGSLPTATKSGYVFKGWYTKKSGGTLVIADSFVKSNKKHSLYAQWKKQVPYPGYITESKYKAITRGMSYSQVYDIIGGVPNTTLSWSDGSGSHVSRKWITPENNGSYAWITFTYGKVDWKTNDSGWTD